MTRNVFSPQPTVPAFPASTDVRNLRAALIRYFSARARDRSDAEDLAQDVLQRVATRAGESAVDNLSGYAFRTAASVWADHLRRRKAHRCADHVAFDPEQHGGRDLDPLSILVTREMLGSALDSLARLPERTRAAFLLRRLDGQQFKQVAIGMGVSVSAVEKHVAKAALAIAEPA